MVIAMANVGEQIFDLHDQLKAARCALAECQAREEQVEAHLRIVQADNDRLTTDAAESGIEAAQQRDRAAEFQAREAGLRVALLDMLAAVEPVSEIALQHMQDQHLRQMTPRIRANIINARAALAGQPPAAEGEKQ